MACIVARVDAGLGQVKHDRPSRLGFTVEGRVTARLVRWGLLGVLLISGKQQSMTPRTRGDLHPHDEARVVEHGITEELGLPPRRPRPLLGQCQRVSASGTSAPISREMSPGSKAPVAMRPRSWTRDRFSSSSSRSSVWSNQPRLIDELANRPPMSSCVSRCRISRPAGDMISSVGPAGTWLR
jgi:hypothetical protein